MTPDELAKIIAASLLRHQSRGLVDAAAGMDDVVIHGRADLTAVARDLLNAPGRHGPPPRRSWAGWFVTEVELRKGEARAERRRQGLAEHLRSGATPVELALSRLRLRAMETDGDL
jgi:hypothetical protein